MLAQVMLMLLMLATPVQATGALDNMTVVLDAGHGGFDLGTKRRFGKMLVTEAQLTWGVVTELAPLLTAQGARVVLTTHQMPVQPEFPVTVVFGQDTIPLQGADVFWLNGQPSIRGDRASLERRLLIAHQETELARGATVIFLSLHFDHVLGGGCPSGARIIYPAGAYDTLLVASLYAVLDSAGLLRSVANRPSVANGRSGLGKHLLVLRQVTDPRRVTEKKQTRLIFNTVTGMALVELANLPNNHDWQRLQLPGALRQYAQVLSRVLLEYARQRRNLTP